MSHWVRLWDDMPTDPKWRVIARRSGRPLPEILAVFVFMMTNAGANAAERGTLSNWSDEDVGAALDLDGEHVKAIRDAMQGKTLDGERLSGWERRQPKREDGSADRSKAWREEQRRMRANEHECERARTQENAEERPDADTEKSREDKNTEIQEISQGGLVASPPAPRKASRAKPRTQLPEDAQPSERDRTAAAEAGLSTELFRTEWRKFRDYHRARGSMMADWSAAWRTWLGNVAEFQRQQPRAGPARSPVENGFVTVLREIGAISDGHKPTHDNIIDITPVSAEQDHGRSGGVAREQTHADERSGALLDFGNERPERSEPPIDGEQGDGFGLLPRGLRFRP